MSKSFKYFKKLVEIILFLIVGIIFLSLGVWFLTDTVSIAIFILVILYFSNYILIDIVLVSNIIFICGIVLVVFGIVLFFIDVLVTAKTIKKREIYEERQDYMNLGWLRDQYYELGRRLEDIETDQGVSIMTIKNWIYKLEVKSSGLGEEE